MSRDRAIVRVSRSRPIGLLLALLLFVTGVPLAPTATARQADDDPPVDLAAMVLRPSDLEAEGTGMVGDTRYYYEALTAWNTLGTGHIILPESVEHSAVAGMPDPLIGDLYHSLEEAGWRQQFRTALSGASDRSPLYVSTVGEFADKEGAEDAFDLLTNVSEVPGVDEVEGVAEVGDESATHRDSSDLVIMDGDRITLTFRYENFIGAIQVYEVGSVEIELLEALAETMIERIETVLDGDLGGLAHLVLRLDTSVAPIFERYDVLDGDMITIFYDTEDDREERADAWAHRDNAFRIDQAVPRDGREVHEVPYYSLNYIQFENEDAAIDYLAQFAEDHYSEPLDDAETFGDESFTFPEVAEQSGVESTGFRISTRVDDVVIHLFFHAPEESPDLGELEELMSMQLDCLDAGACLEKAPIPASVLDPVCVTGPVDESDDPLGHEIEGEAPMAGGNAAQTGEQPGPGLDGDPELLWRFEADGNFDSPPVVAEGLVVIGSGDGDVSGADGNLYALDAATGERAWCAPTGGKLLSAPAYADGLVVSPQLDPRVQIGQGSAIVAYILETGEELWRAWLGGTAGDVLIEDRTVLVRSSGVLTALDLETGALLWEVTLDMPEVIITGVAMENGAVYFSYSSGSERPYGLRAVDTESGEELWAVEIENDANWSTYFSGGPVVADGLILTGNSSGGFTARDAESGETIWSFVPGIEAWDGVEHEGMNFNTPAVADGVVYVGTGSSFEDIEGDRFVFALDAETGEERWSVEMDDPITMQPAIVDGVVYAGETSGLLHALDAESGDHLWTFELDGELGRHAPVVVDGVLYITTPDGSLYAIAGDERDD